VDRSLPSSAFSATDNEKATRALAVCIGAGEKAAHGRENAQQDVEKVDKSGNRADGGVGMIFVAAVVVVVVDRQWLVWWYRQAGIGICFYDYMCCIVSF
jgi:hypothetical protein